MQHVTFLQKSIKEMLSASSSAPSTDRIRRRRVTTACTTCRDRRIKCDRARPVCTQCTKGGRRCKYVDQDKPKIEFVDQLQTTPKNLDEKIVSPSGTWDSVIHSQAEFIRKTKDGKDFVPLWVVAATAEAEEASRPQILQLHESLSVSRPYVIPMGALGDKFAFALTHHLPSRETCQSFFESFVSGVHPFVPICNIQTLRQQYDDFWATISPSYSVESLALVLAVLYTGAVNATTVDTTDSSTILRLYEKIFEMVDLASYHPRDISVSIKLIQGFIIMNSYTASQLAPFSAFGFLPQVIRFAQSLRLHTETKQVDAVEIDIRRQIWWHLLSLDIESTIATGLPTIIHRSGYTTQLPALRQHSTTPTNNELLACPSESHPMVVAMQGHYHWAHQMQTWFASFPSREEVLNFKILIESHIDLIPDNKGPEFEWARRYLKMQIDRAYCMLGLRFWQLDQYKGTGCHSEVVETSRSFLSHYLQLSTLPTMTRFSWFLPGLIQPIHALIILLMHLSTCHNICDEEPSRYLLDQIMRLRVHHIMRGSVVPPKALLQSDCRPQRANTRYLIMVELRKRVWKKVGWDSDGKSINLWAGARKPGEVVGDGENQFLPDQQPDLKTSHGHEEGLKDLNTSWNMNESTGMEGLDNILAGDPMDLFQWDEWESLASEFFAS